MLFNSPAFRDVEVGTLAYNTAYRSYEHNKMIGLFIVRCIATPLDTELLNTIDVITIPKVVLII